MRNELKIKLRTHYYPLATEEYIDTIADSLLNVTSPLLENVRQWAKDEPITDIWIHEKYCVRTVLKLRRNTDFDFVSAILALDRYAKDPTPIAEQLLRGRVKR